MERLWPLDIRIDSQLKKAVYLQITDAIIEAISTRRLKPNEILPSTRQLALKIGVNRNTLIKALDILLAEGWLKSQPRVGIFVANIAVDTTKLETPKTREAPIQKPAAIVVDDGVPNTQIAPIKALSSAYRSVFNLKSKWQILGYGEHAGSPELRQLISQMLNHKRGMHTSLQDVCITRGSQMALYLTAQCLLSSNDAILVETPGYAAAWEAFKSAGAEIVPVNVDSKGIVIEHIEALLKAKPHIKALYITPHHQYPTTVSLSLERRLKLIELSNTYAFTIIEDDYDYEFHYGTRPLAPLASYLQLKRYVYIGSFSKIVAPSLRIGYAVSAPEIIQKMVALRSIIDVQNDLIMEAALVELIKSGALKRHIKRATKLYKHKRDFVHQLFQKHLKNLVTYTIPDGGLAFWIRPLTSTPISELVKHLASENTEIIETSTLDWNSESKGLRIGFGSLSEVDLETVVLQLKKALS